VSPRNRVITLDSDEYLHVVNGHKFRPIEFNYVLIKTANMLASSTSNRWRLAALKHGYTKQAERGSGAPKHGPYCAALIQKAQCFWSFETRRAVVFEKNYSKFTTTDESSIFFNLL